MSPSIADTKPMMATICEQRKKEQTLTDEEQDGKKKRAP